MTPIEKLVSIAKGELGYTEQPKNSNNTKYGQVYGIQGVYWCVMFLWWLYREAGLSSIFYDGKRVASCRELLNWAKKNNRTVSVTEITVGDIVLLSFSKTSDPEHCGLVVDASDFHSYFKTIEGNTTPGEEGSQDNGGCVALKTRSVKNVVAVIRPDYDKLDYIGHWAEDDIFWGIEKGLVKGYDDGGFKPNKALTRAEMITLLRRYDDYRFGGSNK